MYVLESHIVSLKKIMLIVYTGMCDYPYEPLRLRRTSHDHFIDSFFEYVCCEERDLVHGFSLSWYHNDKARTMLFDEYKRMLDFKKRYLCRRLLRKKFKW